MVLNMSACTTEDAWVQPVARPKAIISCMRLNQQACYNNVVEEPCQLVLRRTENADVLHDDVYRDLEDKIGHSVVHGIGRKHTPGETRDLVVLVMSSRAVHPAHSVHREVQPAEEEVVGYDAKRHFTHQATACGMTKGRWLGVPECVENGNPSQISHELEVGTDCVVDQTIGCSEYAHASRKIGNRNKQCENDERNRAAKGLAHGQEGRRNQHTSNDHNMRGLGIVTELRHAKALKLRQCIK
mmetsp:Transcript_102016/g.288019  ORF Transcript_102016/g.288019 Transcript_102016/m.288019 type:complete len:242 (-) Transcript_102016:295-1020(-)